MAGSNIGGSEGNENRKLVIEEDPTDYSMDELFENCPPDQERTDPEQNLHQGFDPPAGSNGCLPEPLINRGPNHAAASTQWSIAQQHSGQSPVIFTENPSSQIPDSVLKKRGYNKKYRENQKKQKQGLLDGKGRLECDNGRLEREKHELEEQMKSLEAENGRLKREKHELEEQMKSVEVENGRLKREKHELEEQMKSFEGENGRLKREKHEVEGRVKSFEGENGRLEREKHEVEERVKSFEGENGRLKREKHEIEEQMKSFEGENGRLKLEIQVKEQEMKSSVATEFKRFRDEFDSFRRHNEGQLARIQNKVDTWKRSTSSSKEFWTESEEEDAVNSTKNFCIIRASESQILANKGVAASSYQLQKTVLRLDLHDDKAKQKAMEAVAGLLGIDSISMDMKEKKLTVIGEIDPVVVVTTLRKVRKQWQHTYIVTVGPAKEEKKDDKKKDESRKDGGKKEDKKKVDELFEARYPYYPPEKSFKARYPFYPPYYHELRVDESPTFCTIC